MFVIKIQTFSKIFQVVAAPTAPPGRVAAYSGSKVNASRKSPDLSQFYTLFNTNSDKLILIKKNKLQTFKDALFGSSKNSTYKIMCSYNLDICHIGRAVRSVSFIAI